MRALLLVALLCLACLPAGATTDPPKPKPARALSLPVQGLAACPATTGDCRLILTWVRFSDYTATAPELQAAAQELFQMLASGALRAPQPQCLPLERAAEAHRLLESGQTTGPLVLLP